MMACCSGAGGPMGRAGRFLTVPFGGLCCTTPSTCGFRLLGAAYAASGQFQVAGNAAKAWRSLQSRARGMSGTASI
jgi:hypothetical protein